MVWLWTIDTPHYADGRNKGPARQRAVVRWPMIRCPTQLNDTVGGASSQRYSLPTATSHGLCNDVGSEFVGLDVGQASLQHAAMLEPMS
nr:hypothetical protein CFP56_09995 [Quercus suber]